ncbi:hypothetical protein [Ensifer sp. BR816]|uniref:hypothetical protein n=1 Tax=Rhizobium sp. (strain BR816) TaxID=1057002 RepID=UPI0018DF2C82|nr:hypothetical protein [Ensifer sp. BR816]
MIEPDFQAKRKEKAYGFLLIDASIKNMMTAVGGGRNAEGRDGAGAPQGAG